MTQSQTHAPLTISLKTIATCAVMTILLGSVSSCASHRHEIPNWGGGSVGTADSNPAPIYTPPQIADTPPVTSSYEASRTTFTQGCTGGYSVRDQRTNREIISGRAFNSGRGLIALDAQGRQTRAISSGVSQSVLFLPDCNCRLNGSTRTSSALSPSQNASLGTRAPVCTAS
jgi:hypothetical protein